jgi:alpha-glucosidase/alpha-D-xyloside xylohydrolase
MLLMLGVGPFGSVPILAQDSNFVLDRDGRTIVLEPYAPNIIRVTLSNAKATATASAGYGLVGAPSKTGWTHEQDSDGNDVFRSGRLVVHVSPGHLAQSLLPHRMPLDDLNESLRNHYFGGDARNGPNEDAVSVTTASGQTLLNMQNWSMVPNQSDTAAAGAEKQEQEEAVYRVSATFDSPADEHYYGLGQQQQGNLDLRDHQIHCWHDYSAIGGQNVCVPFMISSRGYGLI